MNYRKKAILMVVALFCLNIAMLAQAVSLKMNNVSVKEAMTQLKNKSGSGSDHAASHRHKAGEGQLVADV